MTGELVNQIWVLLHGMLSGPWSDPDRRVGHGELVKQRVHLGSCEPFDQRQVLCESVLVNYGGYKHV